MRSAKSEPIAASSTPSPTLALGTAARPAPGTSPAAPCSSQGFDVTRWVESHHTATTVSPEKKRIVTPTGSLPSRRLRLGGLVLRDEVLPRAGHVVVVGPAVDDR